MKDAAREDSAAEASQAKVDDTKKIEQSAQQTAEGQIVEQRVSVEEAPSEPLPAGPVELEKDATADERARVDAELVKFLPADTTLNVLTSTVGGLLMCMGENGLQHLLSGARASVGIKSGRYMFEAKVIEQVPPIQDSTVVRNSTPKHLLRIGFSTADVLPIMGDAEDSICFDSEGCLCFNKVRTPVTERFDKAVLSVLINLDSASPNANTISLFKDGERACQPQPIPPELHGKALFPTVTFRGMTVHVNLGSAPCAPLGFRCRTVQDASKEDAVILSDPPLADGRYEVLAPVCLPDEGTFQWLDHYLPQAPRRYTELSDRKLCEWATRSGLQHRTNSGVASNDRPDLSFGLQPLEEGLLKASLYMVAPIQQRHYIVMEVKGNLVAADRQSWLKRFCLPHFKKVAKVLIGTPDEEFKMKSYEGLLQLRQYELDAFWHKGRQERAHKKTELEERKAGRLKRKSHRDLTIEAAQKKRRLIEEAKERAVAKAKEKEENQRAALEQEKKEKGEDPDAQPMEQEAKEGGSAEAGEATSKDEKGEDLDAQPMEQEAKEGGSAEAGETTSKDEKVTDAKEEDSKEPEERMTDVGAEHNEGQVDTGLAEHKEDEDSIDMEALKKEEEDDAKQASADELIERTLNEEEAAAEKNGPEKAQLTEEESKVCCKSSSKVADVAAFQMNSNFSKFCVPEKSEGFDEIEFAWAPEHASREHVKNWILERKITTRVEDIQPGEWFKSKLSEWQRDLHVWHNKHAESKDPTRKAAAAAARTARVTAAPKTDTDMDAKEGEQKHGGEDPLKDLEEFMDKRDFDVFVVDDVCDVEGVSEPLFAHFAFEDWALLGLRFELHLLTHAFSQDCSDPERRGICLQHLPFYYTRYFKKGLIAKDYGVDNLDDLVAMVDDTLVVETRFKILESQLSQELESNGIFVKLAEEARRDRQCRIDAGDESAQLRFPAPAVRAAQVQGLAGASAPPAIVRPTIVAPSVAQSPAAIRLPAMPSIRGPNVLTPGLQPSNQVQAADAQQQVAMIAGQAHLGLEGQLTGRQVLLQRAAAQQAWGAQTPAQSAQPVWRPRPAGGLSVMQQQAVIMQQQQQQAAAYQLEFLSQQQQPQWW
eukprot:TRINITY_DN14132_c0_g2_i1.p1 TRINITY_DN14132_c0_g2~~TRINITY_DN14132_c0_g2_i1.p1  ORF type:complete len:1166 (+),score=190.04 TRINITY_DN14132_c0_g2_i1:185-3499(+)